MTSANGNQQDGVDIGGARPADLSLPGALDGLRVLEVCDEKGQFCGKLMADNGADLIKIEPPGGEACRSFGPFMDDIPHRERSLSFWHYNTSKRGIHPEPGNEARAGHLQAVGRIRRHRAGKPQARLPGIAGVGIRSPVRRQPRPHHVLADALRPDRPVAGLRQ